VRKIIDTAYIEAEKIIKANRKKLDAVSDELLKTETIDREQFEKIVGKKTEK